MNARYYVPGIGRFASADTIVPDPTNPQSLNRYSYTNNNPVNFVDPSGHVAQLIEGGDGNCQNPLDCVYWDKEIHGELYGRPIGTTLEDVAQAQEQMKNVGETIAGVLWEPADWAIALKDGLQWYDTIGMLPIIPASVSTWGDDVLEFASRHGYDLLPASSIRFTQDSISWVSTRINSAGRRVSDLDLEQLTISIANGWSGDAIRVVEIDGILYSLDNRRLAAAKLLGIDVPIRQVEVDFNSDFWGDRFSTVTNGISIDARRRGDPRDGPFGMVITGSGMVISD